jgi:hypothetical protein
MFSRLVPGFLYEDVTSDITECDVDVVSDLWEMDGREVYRGTRDPRYTHANVYWLYDVDLKRVGCSEHSLKDHGDFRLLWTQESEFATLFQEDGWTIGNDLWSSLPQHVFDRAMNEGWTTPDAFLEHCLYGPLRLVTIESLLTPQMVYTCKDCGRRSLSEYRGCPRAEPAPITYPAKEKIFFVDDDLRVHLPPTGSSIWSFLLRQPQSPSDGGSREPERQEPEAQTASPQQSEPTPPPAQCAPPPPLSP